MVVLLKANVAESTLFRGGGLETLYDGQYARDAKEVEPRPSDGKASLANKSGTV